MARYTRSLLPILGAGAAAVTAGDGPEIDCGASTAEPHDEQNFAPSRSGWPQAEQDAITCPFQTHRSLSLQAQRHFLWYPAHRRAPKSIADPNRRTRYPIPERHFKVLGGQHRFLVNGVNDVSRPRGSYYHGPCQRSGEEQQFYTSSQPCLNIRFWDTSVCPCKQWLVGTEAATENQPLHSGVSRLFETAKAGQTGGRTHSDQSCSAALTSPVLRLQVGIWRTAGGFC